MSTLVIIPTYNERENLGLLVRGVLGLAMDIDILVVDDNSPDGTGEFADALARGNDRVQVMHRVAKQGLASAYATGFQYALDNEYEYVVQMDADLSHRPEDLPRLLLAAKTADVVIGSRNVPGGQTIGWSLLRQIISKGGSLYARLILGLPIRDCTSGFKCFHRTALQSLDLLKLHSNGYAFQVEVNYACAVAGLRLAEVPIIFPDRERGASKMSSHIVGEAMLLVLRLRLGLSQAPVVGVGQPSLDIGSGSGVEIARAGVRRP